MSDRCPFCTAATPDDQECLDHFNLMLFWELDHQLFDLHHLMVLSYYLQHPHLYSREGLDFSLGLLRRFIIDGEYVVDVREQIRPGVQQDKRKFPITPRPGNVGAYPQPVRWTMTAADVVAAGIEDYYASVRTWADSVIASLRAADIIE